MTAQETSELLARIGAVITGSHIVYTSGRHGTAYVNKDAIYPHTRETSRLCRAIAENFRGDAVEVVLGPAVGGTILSQWVAHHLSEITGREVLAVYADKGEGDAFFKIGEHQFLAMFEVKEKRPDRTRHFGLIEGLPDERSNVAELAAALIMKQVRRFGISDRGLDFCNCRVDVAVRNQQVQAAVKIHVKEEAAEAKG